MVPLRGKTIELFNKAWCSHPSKSKAPVKNRYHLIYAKFDVIIVDHLLRDDSCWYCQNITVNEHTAWDYPAVDISKAFIFHQNFLFVHSKTLLLLTNINNFQLFHNYIKALHVLQSHEIKLFVDLLLLLNDLF